MIDDLLLTQHLIDCLNYDFSKYQYSKAKVIYWHSLKPIFKYVSDTGKQKAENEREFLERKKKLLASASSKKEQFVEGVILGVLVAFCFITIAIFRANCRP